MGRKKKPVTPSARTRNSRSTEIKETEPLQGVEQSPAPQPEPVDISKDIDLPVPVVHHKKFGEIRVQPAIEEPHREPVAVNGVNSPPPTEPSMGVPVYKVENDIPLDGSVIIKPGIFSSNTICNSAPATNYLAPITDSSAVFMNVLKGIEMLNSGLLGKIETKPFVEDGELIPMELKEEPGSADSISTVEGESLPDGSPKTEEIDGILASNNIRRSTRIRHIGIMKLKEREDVRTSSPDPEKPVKVKSRWRRSSELEMHRSGSCSPPEQVSIPIPETIPETQDEMRERLQRERKETAEGLKTFLQITENEYRTSRNICKDTKAMICDCSKDDLERGQMGCRSDCLNRMLFLECGQRCALGESCSNKCFQKKRYADCKIFKTEKKGFGLKTEKALPGNTFIMEYVGEVVDQDGFARRVKSYAKDDVKHFYFMSLRGDTIIDATKKGNISRFINHSCDPNAETQKWTVNGELRIGFFTKRPMQAGEEVTFDYRFQRYGKEAQKCYCESANCRGYIGENEDDDDEDDSDEEEEEEEEEQEDSEQETEQVDEEHAAESSEEAQVAAVDVTVVEEEEKSGSEMDLEIESPEAKPQKVKARVGRPRKPKVVKEKKEGATRGRKKKKLEQPLVEDLGLEEEVQRLTITGLKNRAHTLMLSRLMIRAEDWATRSRLLDLISNGEEPCKRLFLDYRGLRFLYSWMQSTAVDPTDRQIRRLQILKTLQSLPIPHKTMLIDSKVLSIVEEWSGRKQATVIVSPDGDSGESEERQKTADSQEAEPPSSDSPPEETAKIEEPSLPEVTELLTSLLESWAHLKEVFKIPKKERMEQMKEHEREADRGYRQSVMSRENLDEIYSRYKLDKDRDRGAGDRGGERDPRDGRERERKRSRDSTVTAADPDWFSQHPSRKLSKQDRRQMFALQVLREDEAARHRMQQEELWSQHKARCEALGLDPNQHPAMDPISGCPIFFDHNSRTWSPNPPFSPYHNQHPHPPPPPHPHHHQHPPSPYPPHPYGNQGYPPMAPNGVSANPLPYPMVSYVNGYPTPSPSVHLTPIYSSSQPRFPPAQNIITITPEPPPPLPVQNIQPPTPTITPDPVVYHEPIEAVEAPVLKQMPFNAPIKLPPKWKMARDPRGLPYYYHMKTRKSQWEPPSWTEEEARAEAERALAAEEEDSSSESSETESEEEVEAEVEAEGPEDKEEAVAVAIDSHIEEAETNLTDIGRTVADTTQPEEDSEDDNSFPPEPEPPAEPDPEPGDLESQQSPQELPSQSDAAADLTSLGSPVSASVLPIKSSLTATATATVVPSPRPKGTSKRRPGLVQERIISPRQESTRADFKKYKELKLQRAKRRKEARRESEKLKADEKKKKKKEERLAAGGVVVVKKKKRDKKVTSAVAESSTDKKIKENFKLSIAGAIVHHLNAFRKPDCKSGRITSNDDFKHLARKLTHFVMLKELKHCQSVDDLQCNESVKVKARDFVRKYMAKFGAEYERDVNDSNF